MIWTLNKAIAVITVKIFFSTMVASGDSETIKQYRTTLDRLTRILKHIQDSQMMHPSLLLAEYGSLLDYLKKQLSTDDYSYFVSLQPVASPSFALVVNPA